MCTQWCLFCCQTVQGVVFLNTTTVGVPKFLNAPFCLFSCCYDSKESWCMCLYGAPVLWCVSVCEREWKRYLFSVELCLCVCAVSACAQQSVDKRLRGGEEKLAALFCWKYANAIHLVFISQMFALFAAFTFDFFFFFGGFLKNILWLSAAGLLTTTDMSFFSSSLIFFRPLNLTLNANLN